MINSIAKVLAIIIFIPGGLLWFVGEAVYVLAACLRVVGYSFATVFYIISGLLTKEERKDLLEYGCLSALKDLTHEEFVRQRKALRLSSSLLYRDDD